MRKIRRRGIGSDGITKFLRLSEGIDAKIEAPFMGFQNASPSYPIRVIPDDVLDESYRSSPKDLMDTVIMPEGLREERAIQVLPHGTHGRRRILYVGNCSEHNSATALTAALEGINTEIRHFPPNETHLVQRADSFVIKEKPGVVNVV